MTRLIMDSDNFSRKVTWWITAVVSSCLFLARPAWCCGGVTHIEISHRAQNHFTDTLSGKHYEQLLLKHPDAFQAGSPFPDTFYPNFCAKGIYHNVSENTHWSEFQNASIDYIRSHYPQPWDEATEKLVVFLFGVVSHQVADISWHSLGIPQGLITTMAQQNFHGQYGSSHTAADFGGAIMNVFELNFPYVDTLKEWYLPLDDLEKIYLELYKKPILPADVIVNCSAMNYAVVAGTLLAAREAFSHYAREAPFLLDQKEDYFLGGFDDMAGWVERIWTTLIQRIENGNRGCSVPHNPLFIWCNSSSSSSSFLKQDPDWPQLYPEKNGFYREPRMWPVSAADVIVERHLRGVILRPSQKIKNLMKKRREEIEMRRDTYRSKLSIPDVTNGQLSPSHIYTVNQSYAKIGWSFAVADVNGDGREDVAVGAPGWGSVQSPQEGRVFLLYGGDEGLPKMNADLETLADLQIPGIPGQQSRFGAALGFVDLNQDGLSDLAVGSPALGSNQLSYTGGVFVYFGDSDRRSHLKSVNITITCSATYCGLGWAVARGDVNGDGHDDLVLGAPFAPGPGQQRGLVAVLFSSPKFKGFMEIPVEKLNWLMYGTQEYGWLGYSVGVHPHPGRGSLMWIGEPGYRLCARKDCKPDLNDTQTVGRLFVYQVGAGKEPHLLWKLRGASQFAMMGVAAAVGAPYADGSPVLAVSSPGETTVGSVVKIDTTLHQAGRVRLYNVSDLRGASPPLLASMAGDRRFGRFGNVLEFADLHKAGVDDLVVGSPLRTADFTEELSGAEEGRVYIFSGGPKFPRGDITSQCGTLSLITPCPGEKASEEVSLAEERSRFGSQISVIKAQNQTSLLVTAVHSSRGARLSGAIGVVNFRVSP